MTDESTSAEYKKKLSEAIAFHRAGELTDAERCYMDVLKMEPEQSDALQLLGVVSAQMGNTALAIQRVRQSIAINPDQPGALNNLGNMLAEEKQYDEAIEAYQRAIHLRPDDGPAHQNLGHVFSLADRPLDAIKAYRRATELQSENASAWDSLGESLQKVGRSEEAVTSFRKALELAPEYTSIMDRLGKSLRILGRLEEAREVYQQWLTMMPDHPIASHYLIVCDQSVDVPDRASKDYVKKTFDDFADDFDSRLADLAYRAPELLGQKISQLVTDDQRGTWNVVDLGCGTGLCGRFLRDVAKKLVGVDLSPKMLAKADERHLYDELVEAELTEYLDGCRGDQDLLLSADTLIYIGDLQSTFTAASRALRPGGYLVFSLEKLVDMPERSDGHDGFRLGASGRYMHRESCVREWLAASGFEVLDFVEAEVRREGLQCVIGFLVTAVIH
ncbi:MAG: tetratricopeptide repeat protein [Planctomycetales bacterium]|nr:tetratricopeptide repeat protein [Planctomycetales bacterium]